MSKITDETHYIKPHSIAGNKVEIITRHPEIPHPIKDTECNFKIYRFRTQDNTEVTVLTSTRENCLGDLATKKNKNDKLTGKRVLIISKDRKSLSKPKVVPHTAKHKTNLIITNEYTYCELHEEYSHILNSKSYMEEHQEKINITDKIKLI